MHAYDEVYVDDASECLGGMLDVAVSAFGLSLEDAYDEFLSSDYSRWFSAGDPSVVAGKCGVELALDVFDRVVPDALTAGRADGRLSYACEGPVYWTGWAIARYQWSSGLSFSSLNDMVPVSEVRGMFDPYHEMDIRQFFDALDRRVARAQGMTNLKRLRMSAGYSQGQLARASGVSVRTIQHYEQRAKDINRASLAQVMSLAQALCCQPTDLAEPLDLERYEYAVVRF